MNSFNKLVLACASMTVLSLGAQINSHKTLYALITENEHGNAKKEVEIALHELEKYSHKLYHQSQRHKVRGLSKFNIDMTEPVSKVHTEKQKASLTFHGTKMVEGRDNYFGRVLKTIPALMHMYLKVSVNTEKPYIWTVKFYRYEQTLDNNQQHTIYKYKVAKMLYNAETRNVIYVK